MRVVQEQYDLTIAQFACTQPETSICNFIITLNWFLHRFKDIDLHNKEVLFPDLHNKQVHAVPGDPHCLIKLLDMYFSRLPPHAKCLYMYSLMSAPSDPSKPWYTKVVSRD